MRRRSAVRHGAVVAACALVVLTACSGPGPVAATPSAPPAPGGQATAAPVDAPPAQVPGRVLARTTVPIAFDLGGEVDVAVTQLDVAGKLLRLGLTFTASLPPGSKDVQLGAVLAANENQPGAAVSPELIDPVNLKAYEAVAGDLRTGSTFVLSDGVPATIVFYFAAPQDEVTTFDVVVSSRAPTIADVPFSR